MLEGVAFTKLFILAFFLLGGLGPPHLSEAVNCYRCVENTLSTSSPYKNCIQDGVPIPANSDIPNNVECTDEDAYDKRRCLRQLEYNLGKDRTHVSMNKGCVTTFQMKCIQKSVGEYPRDCYVMSRDDFNRILSTCKLEEPTVRNMSLENDGTGNSAPRQFFQVMVAFCVCTGEYCNERFPYSIYQAIGVPIPGSPMPRRQGSRSSTHFPRYIKWTILVGLMMATLTCSIITRM